MALFIDQLDRDTVAVHEQSALLGPTTESHRLIRIGEAHAGIPYGVWAQFQGRTVTMKVIRAAAEARRRGDDRIASQGPTTRFRLWQAFWNQLARRVWPGPLPPPDR